MQIALGYSSSITQEGCRHASLMNDHMWDNGLGDGDGDIGWMGDIFIKKI